MGLQATTTLGHCELADQFRRRRPLLDADPAFLGQFREVLQRRDGQTERREHHEVEGLLQGATRGGHDA